MPLDGDMYAAQELSNVEFEADETAVGTAVAAVVPPPPPPPPVGDYNAGTKTWVRCRTCRSAHPAMLCCVGGCNKWCTCTVIAGTNTAAISCKTHSLKYAHVVPQQQ